MRTDLQDHLELLASEYSDGDYSETPSPSNPSGYKKPSVVLTVRCPVCDGTLSQYAIRMGFMAHSTCDTTQEQPEDLDDGSL